MKNRGAWVLLVVVGLAACNDKSEIKVYRIAKPAGGSSSASEISDGGDSAMPPTESAGAPAGAASTVPAGAVPSNWEAQPLAEMRQASFLVKDAGGKLADISLVRLGGGAGGPLDNVNRWLNQLGQPPIDEAKLGQIAQHLNTSMGDVTAVDLQGLPAGADPLKDGRIVAAMVAADGSTMFFKMRGNADLVEAQKPDFLKWVASVCNGTPESKSPPMAAAAAPTQGAGASAGTEVKWKTPEGWKEVPASSMRFASFSAAGANGETADISIITFPGDGGGDVDNVNRWRRQIGLEPFDAAAVSSNITPLAGSSGTYSTVDMTGGETRMLAAWTRREGQSWFFKITGPRAVVEREKQHFVDFVRSVHFQ